VSPDRIRPGSARNKGTPPPAKPPQDAPSEESELAPAATVPDVEPGAEAQLDWTSPTETSPVEMSPIDSAVEPERLDAPADEAAIAEDAIAEPSETEELEEPGEVEDRLLAPDEQVAVPEEVVAIPDERSPLPQDDGGSAASPPASRKSHGFFRRLYYGETNLDFVGRRRWWFTVSAVLILAGVISLATRGLNLDIEFVGGTSWTVQSPSLSVTQVRSSLTPYNLNGATITILGSGSKRSIQVEAKLPKGQTSTQTQDQLVKVEDTLANLAHVSPQQVSIESVGASWGSSVTSKAIEALIVFFVLVAIYISIFFEWRMAVAAIVAVIHDILVVVGVYSLTGFDVTPDTVVAILTILGYSLYDTIVVFDRVRDNLKGVGAGGRLTISDIVNLSMNQTLARSVNTSLVAVLPIFAVLILGAEILGATTLQYFGWALLIGLTSGAYSSIFIAAPIVAMLKEREPRWRRIRERIATRGSDHLVLSPAALAAGLFGSEGASPATNRSRARAAAAAAAAGSAGAGTGTGDEEGDGPPAPVAATSAPRRPSPSTRPAPRRPSGGPKRKGGRR
jgi:preprotein translocase subunit SecF